MNTKKVTTLLSLALLITTFTFAQDEMRWSFSLEDRGNGEVTLVADVQIKQDWYLYDTKIPEGGPTPTQISFDNLSGATASFMLRARKQK